MRIHNHCFLFILLLSLVFPISLKADGVKGRVVDEETGMPIADANIQLVVKIYNGQTTSVTVDRQLGLVLLELLFHGARRHQHLLSWLQNRDRVGIPLLRQ